MKSRKYLTIDTSTVDGLKKCERLIARGWETIRTGLFLVYLVKRS